MIIYMYIYYVHITIYCIYIYIYVYIYQLYVPRKKCKIIFLKHCIKFSQRVIFRFLSNL